MRCYVPRNPCTYGKWVASFSKISVHLRSGMFVPMNLSPRFCKLIISAHNRSSFFLQLKLHYQLEYQYFEMTTKRNIRKFDIYHFSFSCNIFYTLNIEGARLSLAHTLDLISVLVNMRYQRIGE